MTLTVPRAVRRFTDKLGITRVWQKEIVPRIIAAILLCPGKVSFASTGRTIVTEQRNRSSIQRFFSREGFKSRDLYEKACDQAIAEAAPQEPSAVKVWVLAIDGTSNKRGGFSKIENALKYREKKKHKKSGHGSSKAHTFLMGIIITDKGVRIPVPRRTWYTKRYCRDHHRKYVSQVDLMVLMVETTKVPAGIKLIVVADEYFEGRKIKDVCDRLNYAYICPVDSCRCYANEEGKSTGESLHKHGKSIPDEDLKTIRLLPGKEETASYRRYTGKGRRKARRIYRAASEVANVSGLGKVRIVYSWKSPVYDPRIDYTRESFKVLLTNDTTLTMRQIIEYYELRWQIEVFFREIKSQIGLCDYTGMCFQAFERFVDMILLSFLFLEQLRVKLLSKNKFARYHHSLAQAHTADMLNHFATIAMEDDLRYIDEAISTDAARRRFLDMVRRRLANVA
jgi:hypothetical protein